MFKYDRKLAQMPRTLIFSRDIQAQGLPAPPKIQILSLTVVTTLTTENFAQKSDIRIYG